MRACSSQFFVLEHYLRLATRKPDRWLSSLQVLTGSTSLSQEVRRSDGQEDFFARLAFLQAEHINLCGIYLHSAVKIFGANAEASTIVMPLQGSVEFKVEGQHFLCAPGIPFVLEPNAEFCASVSDGAHLFIVQLAQPLSQESNALPESGDPKLASVLDSFLVETPFFRNHEHAMERVRRFERALALYRDNGVWFDSKRRGRPRVGDERRICQAVHLINERLELGVEFESIARDSGLSLRNLYYLMKKYTGMTPYNYCRSRRLIKARESLICSYPEGPLIAEHALRCGFNHLGRFSSYYREHFGEYPSETIRNLESLTRYGEELVTQEC
ncbi:AraC family transcriptional regulator [Marinobacter sp.]|uniref:AraC family transcriptional regulator n=1 Tax=Marinobacter sp. TaxID=50741 RepID=UPI003A91064D